MSLQAIANDRRTIPFARNATAPTTSSSSSNRLYLRPLKKARIKNMSDGDGGGVKGRRPNWDTLNDRILLDLMIDEMHKKNYASGNFKNHSWIVIAKAFNAAIGGDCTWSQVKERYRNLKKKFSLYEELLRLSGWGWDPTTQTPIPGYEGAWDEALRVNPKLSAIKRKPFPVYDHMQMLCKNSIATSIQAKGVPRNTNRRRERETSPQSPHVAINEFRNAIPTAPDVEDDLIPDFTRGDSEERMNVSTQQETETNRFQNSPTPQNNVTISDSMATSQTRSKGKGKILDRKSGISALEKIIEISRERNAMLEKVFAYKLGQGSNNVQSSGEEIPSIQQVFKDLRDIPNLPYRVYLKSMNLFTDPNMRLVFSAMHDDDKVEWLKMTTSDA